MRDWELLRRYVEHGDDAAFGEVVREHLDLVYSTCCREVGDPELARDVTQAVFLILSRKAAGLRKGTVLAGWLFNTARFTARNARRSELRRKAREVQLEEGTAQMESIQAKLGSGWEERAWADLEPLLHDALAALSPRDRDAILLRFFQEKSLKETGEALGISADAAQMRVARAVGRLRTYFGKRGFAVPGTALAGLLAARGTQAAPAEALPEILSRTGPGSGGVPAPGNTASGSPGSAPSAPGQPGPGQPGIDPLAIERFAERTIHAMNMLKLKQALVAGLLVTTVGGGVTVKARSLEGAGAAAATAGAPGGTGGDQALPAPSARQLIDRFAANQERVHSFWVKSEDTTRSTGATIKDEVAHARSDFRGDSKTKRFSSRHYYWGYAGHGNRVDEKLPGYTSHMWNGKEYYNYTHNLTGQPDSLTIAELPEKDRAKQYERGVSFHAGAAPMGYFHMDEQRVDAALRDARSLTVRPKTERLGGADCFVLEGVTRFGKYTLWLDPSHGYCLAKAEVLKGPGDLVLGTALPAGSEIRQVINNSRFEQVSGIWVPMESDQELIRKFPESDEPLTITRFHHKKTFVQLNTDLLALKALDPDDIREGSRVYKVTPDGPKFFPVGSTKNVFVWRNGKPQPLGL